MTKLNLGCANDIKQGYMNIDLYHDDPKVYIMDVRDLSFFRDPDCDRIIEEIYASDILEHLEYNDAIKALKMWIKLLKTGGKLFIKTINIEEQIRALQNGFWDLKTFNAKLFAGKGWVDGESRDHDFHKCALTPKLVSDIMIDNGMSVESIQLDEATQNRPQNINFSIWGKKCV